MKSKLNFHWSIILKFKELSDYLTVNELNNICANRGIRSSLKALIFKKLSLKDFEFINKVDITEEIDGYPAGVFDAQVRELKLKVGSIQCYVEKLVLQNNFHHTTLLKFSTQFTTLKYLSLSGFELPLYTLNILLNSFVNLSYLKLKDIIIAICDNFDHNTSLTLPKSISALEIYGLQLINKPRVANPLLPSNFGYNYTENVKETYNLEPQYLPELTNLIISEKSPEVRGNIRNFLLNNNQKFNYLFISALNFKSIIFPLINNCASLTRLQLDNVRGLFDLSIEELEYPEFPYIQHLSYKPSRTGLVQFDMLLLLSFPNLSTLECYYEGYFKEDLIFAIKSLTKLEKLTLTNWNPLYYYDFNLISNSLKSLTFQNIFAMDFNPTTVIKCPNLTNINLINYDLKDSGISEAEAYYSKFPNWKTIIFPNTVRMHSTIKY